MKRFFTFVVAVTFLTISFLPASAEALASKKPDSELTAHAVYDYLRLVDKIEDDPADYMVTGIPVYGYGQTETDRIYWFLLKNGRILDMCPSGRAIYPSGKWVKEYFPALDSAIADGEPIALVVHAGGFYLVEEDRAMIIDFQFYAKGLNPNKPVAVEDMDFTPYRDHLCEVELIRLGEYRREHGKVWEQDNTETEAKELGFRWYQPGWNEIDGERYYLKKDASLATGNTTIDGVRCRFDENGVYLETYTGFSTSNKGRHYWKNGKLIKNKWIRVKGERKYYAGMDGYFVTGTWEIDGVICTFDKDGKWDQRR